MNANQRLWHSLMSRSFEPRQWFIDDDPPEQGDGTILEARIMWVFRSAQNDGHEVFEVGYYTPDRQWVLDTSHTSREEAAARVHWLNGGSDNPAVARAAREGYHAP